MSLFSSILKYVWPQMRKRKGVFTFILFFYTVRIFLDFTIVPVVFKKIIDTFSSPMTPTSGDDAFFWLYIIIGMHVFLFIIARLVKFKILRFEAGVVRDLREFTFQKLQKNSYSFFSNVFAGSLVTKSRRFVTGFETAMDIFIYNFWKFGVILIGSLGVLISQSLTISAIFGIWVVINITVVLLLLRRKIKFDLSEAEQDSKISGRLADVFGNILAVKFFSANKKEAESFREYTKEGEKRSIKAWFAGGQMDLVQHLMIVVIESTVLYFLIVLWLRGTISLGTIVLIETYMVIIANNLWDLSNSLVRFMKAIADMKEMVDIFEVVPDIKDSESPEKLRITSGHIVFKNVHFKYAIGGEVLSDFNLDVKPGERIGIVGHSGAGKSTITKILLRFNDITSGSVTIDGQDIRNVLQDDLRSVITYVPQEPILFHRSIKENISYGKSDATDEEITDVSKKAHAHEFISNLPQQYDTFVGERGVKLSGGERQRVAIARAMLKPAPVLVLDEATSSLDSVSESYIQDSFTELMKGKTSIVIAHRLSTVQKMDRIIVLDKGKIVEEGTHKELLAKKGFYAELWDHQTGGFLE